MNGTPRDFLTGIDRRRKWVVCRKGDESVVSVKWRYVLGLLLCVILPAGLAGHGATPDLEGTWAMLQVYPRIAQLPLVGESSQTSYVVQFVDVEQDGLSLLMQDRYCFTVIEESSSLATTELSLIHI